MSIVKAKDKVYLLGSTVPVSTYTSFSGCDVCVYLIPDNEVLNVYNNPNNVDFTLFPRVGNIQGISWDIPLPLGSGKSGGTIVFTTFDRSSLETFPTNDVSNILLHYNDEYGHMAIVILEGVECKKLRSGVAIDDIVTEENIDFTFKRFYPMRKI